MVTSGLTDLELLLLACRNDRSRGLAAEAVACYNTGAYRAAIVMTWIAVAYDLVDKLRELALTGDPNAAKRVEQFDEICRKHDLSGSLRFERELLELVRDQFELLSELEYQDLDRLFQDRHRCAHPSMISPAEEFRPTAEVARYHLRNAVTQAWPSHPPRAKPPTTPSWLIWPAALTQRPSAISYLTSRQARWVAPATRSSATSSSR